MVCLSVCLSVYLDEIYEQMKNGNNDFRGNPPPPPPPKKKKKIKNGSPHSAVPVTDQDVFKVQTNKA